MSKFFKNLFKRNKKPAEISLQESSGPAVRPGSFEIPVFPGGLGNRRYSTMSMFSVRHVPIESSEEDEHVALQKSSVILKVVGDNQTLFDKVMELQEAEVWENGQPGHYGCRLVFRGGKKPGFEVRFCNHCFVKGSHSEMVWRGKDLAEGLKMLCSTAKRFVEL